MSIVFRKSVLGFNKDDVLNYINELFGKINKIEEDFNQKDREQKNNIIELSESLNNANAHIAKLIVENDKLNEELESYRAEKEKYEQLSEVIGKLYLVSKLNAESVIRSAKDMRARSEEEVEKNLKMIEELHSSLLSMKDIIVDTSSDFSDKIEGVTESLSVAKAAINSDKRTIGKNETNMNVLMDAADSSIKA